MSYPVEINANPQLIDLDSAKAYAVELIRLTKKYKLEQRRLSKIEFGYTPENPLEIGEVYFEHDSNKPKILRLRTNTDSRDSKYAVGNSRCEKSRIAFAPATHEFGHLLFQVRGNSVGTLKFFEESIVRLHSDYLSEFDGYIEQGDVESAAKICIGRYGHKKANDFLAECFQEHCNCNNPSKYAVKVGELIDKWFRR